LTLVLVTAIAGPPTKAVAIVVIWPLLLLVELVDCACPEAAPKILADALAGSAPPRETPLAAIALA